MLEYFNPGLLGVGVEMGGTEKRNLSNLYTSVVQPMFLWLCNPN